MKYFDTYVSNTCAGSGNQLFFHLPKGESRTGRVFYKITAGGRYEYALLFSNIMDSTFSDGSVSHKNLILDEWTILAARAGRSARLPDCIPSQMRMDEISITDWQTLTFDGKAQKCVAPGEFFACDPVELEFHCGEYLCVELTFTGKTLPYHEESILPIFVNDGGVWAFDKHMPLPGQIGCHRAVKARVGYLGDSITQGIGPAPNSYKHWNALVSNMLGDDFAFWNLGIGFGRANDAASDGAWLFKARQNDLVIVCYGVNDIQKRFTEESIKRDLTTIVRTLRAEGKHVVIQTIPPFNYTEERIDIFNHVNAYIKTELSKEVDLVFDASALLCGDAPHLARYGGHPNEEGNRLWAEALYAALRPLFDRLYP